MLPSFNKKRRESIVKELINIKVQDKDSSDSKIPWISLFFNLHDSSQWLPCKCRVTQKLKIQAHCTIEVKIYVNISF